MDDFLKAMTVPIKSRRDFARRETGFESGRFRTLKAKAARIKTKRKRGAVVIRTARVVERGGVGKMR